MCIKGVPKLEELVSFAIGLVRAHFVGQESAATRAVQARTATEIVRIAQLSCVLLSTTTTTFALLDLAL